MADVSIKYKGAVKAELNASGTKTVKTAGKYCEGDIEVIYTDPEKPTQSITVTPTAAGFTVTPDSGKVLSSVKVNGDDDLVAGNVKDGVNIFGVTGTLKSKETVTWHQCPEAVRNYLDNVTYDTDYTYTHVTEYAPTPAVTSNTKPIGKTVDGVTYYNEVPNAETPFSSTNTAGTVKPLDRLRWINTATNNVRDIGGWACDGGTVKYGKLFRGAEVSNSNDLPIFLNDMGIRAELDLQGTGGATIHILSDVVDYCCPVNGENWALYTIANKAQMKEAFRFIFDSVKHNKPLYFHCSYGADRTGTIACIIESLLGMSRSDIDKDWELTSFYVLRQRNQTGATGGYGKLWQNLLSEISDIIGSTWVQKTVNFIASLGFTAAEINAFRVAMIDGNPETVTPDIDTFTVTNNLTHATSDNAATSATEYQPYEANITPANGYAISSVQVLMGGVDITDSVFTGEHTNLYRSISKTLSHCAIDNQKNAVIDGQSYAAEITVDDGYTLDGATVSITMDGTDITNQVFITKEDI